MSDAKLDFEAADRKAQRGVDEYPHLIQPSETAYNLDRCYRASREREQRLEALVRLVMNHESVLREAGAMMVVAGKRGGNDLVRLVEAARKELSR